ncbi:hypothetical protein SNE25_04580 [Mucilaginibacter sabulilitoris]|uniref:Uncharacterized protein n=1 Tax=Mucilaginibacter sabulilitoris TaxID=1173583 RepID=A0ABZ0TNS6_9SPHI|nr:hypothetical protein [Mucilaginibacter sabulilitoris]WPU94796.1 hypothetical protein SNE25_04580 [Mucilaginibacter sabulilitoris]
MLISALYHLETIVSEVVNYNEITGAAVRPEAFGRWSERTALACKQLSAQLLQQLFSNVKDHTLVRYIHYHQATLISLSDQLSGKFSIHSNLEIVTYAHGRKVIASIEGILDLLFTKFYKYCDHGHVVSKDHFDIECAHLNALLVAVLDQLTVLEINDALILAVQESISAKLTDGRYFGVSYREFDYLNKLLRTIADDLVPGTPGTGKFADILYTHNFNSPMFVRWYQNEILVSKINSTKKNRKQLLQKELERLELCPVKIQEFFDASRVSIQELMVDWMRDQLNGRGASAQTDSKSSPTQHMPLNFSVSQFALLVRLSYLEGAYHLHNISAILRFFSSHFETKKQLHISVKSFTRAFYGTDQKTAAAVRDFLQRMLNILDNTYFPKT